MELNEADLMAPILRFYSSFWYEYHFCMVTELGKDSLFSRLNGGKGEVLSLHVMQRISVQLMSALLFLAKMQFIHGDIKPENVLVMPHPSQEWKLKLIGKVWRRFVGVLIVCFRFWKCDESESSFNVF